VGVGVDRVECLQHPGMGQPVVAVEQNDDLLIIAGMNAAVEILQGPHAHRVANQLDPMTDRMVREELSGIVNLLTLLLNSCPLWHNRPCDEPSMNPRIRRQRGGQT
jgi:hypothetical protein